MRLRRLDLFGFKSFCERTTILFEPGITAIVGPNGCGKSNISDAVLWVLGEQSARVLRGDRMEDLVFNGSERRRPLGMAEVSLTLEEVDHLAENSITRYREICITRRLFRSGESEYLINKSPCRLKDIRDLLMDLGASFKGHGIMEQGKVDEIITASPVERRTIIEETAGITKYKMRRAEAERKLDATQQNLLRVRDIISEVGRQLSHLERQAKKAQTYQALQGEAGDLELRLHVRAGGTLSDLLEKTRMEHSRLCAREAELLAKRSAQEAELEDLRTEVFGQQRGLEQIVQSLHTTESQVLGAEHKITALNTQRRDWQEQSAHLEGEVRELEENILAGQVRLQEQEAACGSLGEQVAFKQSELAGQEAEGRALEEKVSEATALLEEARRQAFEHESAMIQTRNRIAEGEARVAEIRRRIAKAGEHREGLGQERSEKLLALNDATQSLTAHRDRMAQVRQEIGEGQRGLESAKEDFGRREAALASGREALQDKKLRYAMLQDHLQKHLSLQEGARELLALTGPERVSGIHGVLADLIEAQPQYEMALEAVLQGRLGGLVMEGRDEISGAVQTLKNKRAGGVTFIPKAPKLMSSSMPSSLEAARALNGSHEGIQGHALSIVQARKGFEEILKALLGDVLIVRDLRAAYLLWEEAAWPGICVTLEGEVLEPTGVLYAYHTEGDKKGLLQQKRDVVELEVVISRLEQEAGEQEQARRRAEERLNECISRIEGLKGQLHTLELEEVEFTKRSEFLSQDLRRIEEGLELVLLEQQQSAQEQEEIEQGLGEFSRALEAEAGQKSALEDGLKGREGILNGLASKKEGLQTEMTQVKVALSGLKEKQAHSLSQQEQLRGHQDHQREQLQAKGQRLQDLQNRQVSAVREGEELTQSLEGLSKERSSLLQQVRTHSEAISIRQDRLKALETDHRLCRSDLEQAQKAAQEAGLSVNETQLRLEHIREQVLSLTQHTLEEARERLGTFELCQEEAESRLAQLKTKLQAMGLVNLAALQEHQELKERHEFLTRQEQDLTLSIESLQKAISRINQTSTSLFMETFEALNIKFGEVFAKFFEGGTARLVLQDPQNPLDTGMDIVAQPPGKRLRSLQLLSGGEKALTAISLLFASFLIHPGPFCILDEIDAPLDEMNVGRFTEVLRSLTDQSQMILVTHNKKTMEVADVLYGVTMEEPGSSKVVAVRLAEVAG